MGRIPKFTTQKLASSLVGTPGVDTSGANLARTIAQAADTSFRTTMALTNAQTNKKLTEFELELDNVTQQNRQEFESNPEKLTNSFVQKAQNLLQTSLANETNGAVRQKVNQLGRQRIEQQRINESVYEHNQKVKVAFDTSMSTMNTLGQEAFQRAKRGDYEGAFSQTQRGLDDAITTAGTILPSDKTSELSVIGPKNRATGALLGALESNNPAVVYDLLKREDVAPYLSPKEIKQFREEGRKAVKGYQERVEIEQNIEAFKNNAELYQGILTGQADLSVVEQMPDGHAKDLAKRYIIESRPEKTPQQKARAYTELWDKWAAMKDVIEDKPAKLSLKALVDFQNQALQAEVDGVITSSEAKDFQRTMAPVLFQKVSEADGRVGKSPVSRFIQSIFGGAPTPSESSLNAGYKVINGWLNQAKRQDDLPAKARMLSDFITKHGGAKIETDQEAYDLAQKVIDNFVRQENPSIGMLPASPNAVMKESGRVDVLPGQSKLKPEGKIKQAFRVGVHKPTGKRVRVYEDGTIEEIN